VEDGMEATLTTDIYPGRDFLGKVSLVYPTIDPQTRTFTVEITILNKDLALRPGMYAKLKVKLAEKTALIVPSSAVLMREGTANRFIFILEDGIAKRVSVTLGERFDDQLELISETELEGKRIIVAGQSKLENGDAVSVK
nr:efflux RND transporter periplasmic adaptor subunit [Bacteroidales bacterium]